MTSKRRHAFALQPWICLCLHMDLVFLPFFFFLSYHNGSANSMPRHSRAGEKPNSLHEQGWVGNVRLSGFCAPGLDDSKQAPRSAGSGC